MTTPPATTRVLKHNLIAHYVLKPARPPAPRVTFQPPAPPTRRYVPCLPEDFDTFDDPDDS